MDRADFLLEAAKNGIEAGCTVLMLELDYQGDTVKLTCRDDGRGPSIDDCFGLGKSERGAGRGLGLYMLKRASDGRCGLRRENGTTVLEAFLPMDRSFEHLEETLPALFNLRADLTFRKSENGRTMYELREGDLEREDIDPTTPQGMAAIRNMVRLREERSRKENGKADT